MNYQDMNYQNQNMDYQSNDDRRRVLDLLARGKITAEEAGQLLEALAAFGGTEASKAAAGQPGASPGTRRFICINVQKPGKNGKKDQDVNIRVPLALLRGGMRLSTMIPGLQESVTAKLRESGVDIDLAKFDASSIEALLAELGEVHIDVQEGDKQVRITCE